MPHASASSSRHCPACGHETVQRLLWRKNGCDVLRCESCGLGAAITADFDPSAYYTGAYFDGTVADGYADYVGSEAVIRAEFRGIVEGLRRAVPDGKLFEIGAAYGFFLAEARKYYDVHGVELAADAAAFARQRGLDVRTGVVTGELLNERGPFDAMVMLDVIEHLEDPAATLALCAEHLRPGGVLLITTGDFGSVFARLTGAYWRLMTPPQHLWFFTRRSLVQMGAHVGLNAVRVEYPWKRVPLSLVLYQLGRMSGLRLGHERIAALSGIGLPVNLFDAMRVTLCKA